MAQLGPTPVSATRTSESLTGTVADRFVISDRLGKGGMGEVYRAEDSKLKRTVALKRLTPALQVDATYRRRFQEEAERASRFSDSHVAAIYDVIEDRGEMFLVMEYVEGETLRQRLRRPMSLEEFFEVAIQCAEGLAAAHERGIVHCDIKPENIMLSSTGQVKILDFGVAKHLPHSDQSSTVDRAGTMAGTPAYMSPEVLLEKMPDGRADIFSLGVVFYEALTGHHPFLASSFVATTDRIRKETPASIRIFNRQVPEGLEALVSKALSKEKEQRHSSARELLEDLRLVQAGLTPTKLRPLLPSRIARKKKRLIAAVLILIAVAGYAVYRWWPRPPVLAERGWVLIADFDTSGEDAIPDKGVREALTIALQQSQYINVYPRSRVYEVLQRMRKENVQRIDENLGREICRRENLQVLLTGSIQHIGPIFQITVQGLDPVQGKLLFAEKERFDHKEQFFEKTDDLAKRVRKDLGESLLGIEKNSRPLAKVTTKSIDALQRYSNASDAMATGNFEQVPTLLQSALQFDPDFAMAHLGLGEYYSWVVGKNERATGELQRAYDLRHGVSEREQRQIEAVYYADQERYEEAAQSLGVLVSLYPDDAEAHEDLAGAYYNLGQLDQAIAELRIVLRLNPYSAAAYRNLVIYLARNNADEEAIAVFNQAQQRGINLRQLHWGLGLAYLGENKVAAAREEFRQIGQGSETDRELQGFYLAVTDLYEGKTEAAEAQLTSQINTGMDEKGGLQTVRRFLLARIYMLQNQPRKAVAEADLIMRVPEENLQTVDVLSAGLLYARAGEVVKAQQVLRRLNELQKSIPSSWNKSSFHCLDGEIFLNEKNLGRAETSYMAADAEYPQVPARIGMAQTFEGQQRWDQAVQQWKRVLQLKGEILQNGFPPDLAFANLNLARAARRINDINLARAHYQEFLRLWEHGDDQALLWAVTKELQELNAAPNPI